MLAIVLSIVLASAKAHFAVDYNRNEVIAINKMPVAVASKFIVNDTQAGCAVECSKRDTCLAFAHGKAECSLYDERIHPWQTKTVKTASGYSYFYSMRNCPSCPEHKPTEEEYSIINGRRVAFKACTSPKIGVYDAMVACACKGGRLASVPDIETNEVVQNICMGEKAWIGFSGTAAASKKEYDLLRSDSQRITHTTAGDFKNWNKNNPTYDEEVGVVMSCKSGKWLDYGVDTEHKYICEFF